MMRVCQKMKDVLCMSGCNYRSQRVSVYIHTTGNPNFLCIAGWRVMHSAYIYHPCCIISW